MNLFLYLFIFIQSTFEHKHINESNFKLYNIICET